MDHPGRRSRSSQGSVPSSPESRRLLFTLRATVLSLLLGIIGALSAVLIGSASHYSTIAAKDLTGKLMDRISQQVVERTREYLKPAATAAALSRELSRSDVLRSTDWHRIEQFFTHLLRLYPQLAMINYGDEDGNFLMVKRFPVDTPVRGRPTAPANADAPRADGDQDEATPQVSAALAFVQEHPLGPLAAREEGYLIPAGALCTKVIRRTGTPFVLWKYRDREHRLRSLSIARSDPFDPRTRPWYEQSKKSGVQGWTGVYLFYTDKMPGIASATPILDASGIFRASVSVEIELHQLSLFLASARVGDRGAVFLLNQDRELVAFSDVSRLRKRVRVGTREEWVLQRASEMTDSAVRGSFNALLAREARFPPAHRHQFDLQAGQQRWLAMFSPFPPEAGQRWTVGILVPEKDVLGQIQRNRLLNILISLAAILAALILAVFLSKSITRPLARLVAETDRIRRLDLRDDTPISSRLREIDLMVTSVQKMKVGLRSFEKYVPRDLVKELVSSGHEARVQGEKRALSILFSDIAGFTSIAEGLDPAELVSHLNRYFDAASSVLMHHGATIDKYIGDAVMAFWGAPRPQPDHADRACLAALGLRHALDELNATWRAAGLPEMQTRIGVHSGEAVVGNIGSDQRLSYTIIGDNVNLASRIEGIGKIYGTWVTLSEQTYASVKERFVARALDVVAVKGRREGVRLFELRSLRGEASADDLALEALSFDALDHFAGRRFGEAITVWEEIQRLLGGEDQASALMIERCRICLDTPPPPDWNGVFQATHK